MTENTPATSTDPALGSEGDTDQLSQEDMLLDSVVEDALDEGWIPPERDRANHWGETPWEEVAGEPLDQRLAAETPEVWERERPAEVGAEPDRAGRLAEVRDGDHEQDSFALDAGVAGGAASAEEAAMHIVEGDRAPELAEDVTDVLGSP